MLLLDTNVFIWWVSDDSRLGEKARAAIANPSNNVYVSNLSLFECSIKKRAGKLKIDFDEVDQEISESRIMELRFDTECARHHSEYPGLPHSDPFDAALVAQAIAKNMTFVTADETILSQKISGLRLIDVRR